MASLYTKAQTIALNNDHDFHVVAILKRGETILRIDANTVKTHPRAMRIYKNNACAHMHAEMSVLRFAKKGDKLIVMRFQKDGTPTMAKPCKHCQKQIKEAQLSKVWFTDWDGKFQRLNN